LVSAFESFLARGAGAGSDMVLSSVRAVRRAMSGVRCGER
jgi:hypothetical protein